MTDCFLVSAAFFPRTTLLIWWIIGAIPINHTPFIVDLICAILFPRGLVAWWLYEAGYHPLLVAVFVILEILETFGGSVSISSSKKV